MTLADSPVGADGPLIERAVRTEPISESTQVPAALRSRLLIVDDCLLRRDCVVDELSARGAQVAEAWDFESFRDSFENWSPDVIVISAVMRQVRLILDEIFAAGVVSRIVVFGLTDKDDDDILTFAELGILGYHLRNESMEQLITFIGRVAEGESGCSSSVSAILLRRLSQLATEFPESPEPGLLTLREMEVLELLELGLSNQEIAKRLHIATHTVKNHVHNVLSKMGARSRSEAAAIARKGDMLDLQSRSSRHE